MKLQSDGIKTLFFKWPQWTSTASNGIVELSYKRQKDEKSSKNSKTITFSIGIDFCTFYGALKNLPACLTFWSTFLMHCSKKSPKSRQKEFIFLYYNRLFWSMSPNCHLIPVCFWRCPNVQNVFCSLVLSDHYSNKLIRSNETKTDSSPKEKKCLFDDVLELRYVESYSSRLNELRVIFCKKIIFANHKSIMYKNCYTLWPLRDEQQLGPSIMENKWHTQLFSFLVQKYNLYSWDDIFTWLRSYGKIKLIENISSHHPCHSIYMTNHSIIQPSSYYD